MQDGSSGWHAMDALALADMKRAAEAALAHHPDWIALNQLSAIDGEQDVSSYRERLIAALNGVPAFDQLRAIERTLAALPPGSGADEEAESGPEEELPAANETLPPAPPQDLTRIRGIDAATAVRLNGIGVFRYEHIAQWWPADVRRVTDALDLGRRVTKQSWIAQAAMLMKLEPGPAIQTKPHSAEAPERSEARPDAEAATAPGPTVPVQDFRTEPEAVQDANAAELLDGAATPVPHGNDCAGELPPSSTSELGVHQTVPEVTTSPPMVDAAPAAFVEDAMPLASGGPEEERRVADAIAETRLDDMPVDLAVLVPPDGTDCLDTAAPQGDPAMSKTSADALQPQQIMVSIVETVIASSDARFESGMDATVPSTAHRLAPTEARSTAEPAADHELAEILALIRKSPVPAAGSREPATEPAVDSAAWLAAAAPEIKSAQPTLVQRLDAVRLEQKPEPPTVPVPAADQTAVALTRVLAVEAELDTLATSRGAPSSQPEPSEPFADVPAPDPAEASPEVSDDLRAEALPCALGIPEAEVEIVRTGAHPRVRPRALAYDADDLSGPSFAGAEEASVVIVSRASGQTAVRQLPFYQSAPPDSERTIRKFMTALSGPTGE